MTSSKNTAVWVFRSSTFEVPPTFLLAEMHDDPIVAAIRDRFETADRISSKIKLLVSTDPEDQRERQDLIRDLAESTPAIQGMLEHMADLRDRYASVFSRKVQYATFNPLLENVVMLVDLTWLPDDFFDHKLQQELRQKYNEMVENPKNPKGSFNGLNWQPAKDYGCGFQFGGELENTIAFVDVLSHFLTKFGGMDPPQKEDRKSIDLRYDWALGLLSTMEERLQDPHVDFKHVQLDRFTSGADCSGNKKGKTVLPWCFDMPLTDGGLRLAFYGVDDPNCPDMLLETPAEIIVPPKHVLLWR